MRKTDKKLDNQIRETLTELCDELLDLQVQFQWLTHLVDYDRFPQSLKVVCIFESEQAQQAFAQSPHLASLQNNLKARLKALNIALKDVNKHLFLDNEEACERTHQGKWAERLRQH
ncbi:hypothetical protein MAQ5080_01655 [Marinomonas aquimarina]|uniref:Fis family transcriptional regulator n=1 Tax=Marinomonas aquimarina TaxID=295068 RepID=A0A1A8TDH7_9GAMM|nr:Fis family transcriptional regulator [Marinomonas aquimarina]SBS30391.1 hypothetical protein MAQ5080_01655 [Marinomonas aquimarina]